MPVRTKTKSNKKLSITGFFPFLNDWGTIGSLVTALDNVLRIEASNYEIIIVDDGSDESSKDILKTLKKKFPKMRIITHTKNRGYGGALKSGIYNAKMDWIFYTDGDAQYDPRDLHFLIAKMKRNVDVINGYKIKQGQLKFIYLLTGALIFGWNTDYTNLVLFLFTFLAWIIFRLPIKRKEVGIAILIFLFSNIPLLAFDMRHDFLNARSFVNYFTTKHTLQKQDGQAIATDRVTIGNSREEQVMQTALLPFITFSRAIYTASDLNISEQHTYCKAYIASRNSSQSLLLPILAALIIGAFIYLMIKKRRSKEGLGYVLILSFYLIFQLGVTFYAFVFKGDVFEHYLSTLLPYLFIILGVEVSLLFSSKLKPLALILTFLFIIINVSLVLRAYNPFGLNDKIAASKYALTKVGNNAYSLDTLSSCFRWDGFYYPFILNGSHPVKSYQDPNYAWLYDYQVAEKHPSLVVVEVPSGKFEDQQSKDFYSRYQQWVIDRKTFGGIEVLILDNNKGDFH